MPNIKSAEKRVRQSEKSREKNRSVKSKINTARRPIIEGSLDKEAMKKAVSDYASTLDKAVKQGVIKKNTADRRKSRAAKRLAAMK
ncbi:MAG: 30S ribosomal protein S20 [Kiritimatiellae bacterium]|jgi:small subunit ribosomal protein S20|nr:30S ribosomal protein S20 [Kiritimatiellia bacterium]MBR4611504.1 30S ribosomal protein S20 [Kiritimatiellia bacterium]